MVEQGYDNKQLMMTTVEQKDDGRPAGRRKSRVTMIQGRGGCSRGTVIQERGGYSGGTKVEQGDDDTGERRIQQGDEGRAGRR